MQGIIFKPENLSVKRDDILYVFMDDIYVCRFKVESFTETQVIGDFTTNIEPNIQFTLAKDENGLKVIPIEP